MLFDFRVWPLNYNIKFISLLTEKSEYCCNRNMIIRSLK